MAVEVIAQVEHVVLDAEGVADPAGVVHVGDGTAARVGLATPEPQGHADDLAALRQQQGGGHRGVDAA